MEGTTEQVVAGICRWLFFWIQILRICFNWKRKLMLYLNKKEINHQNRIERYIKSYFKIMSTYLTSILHGLWDTKVRDMWSNLPCHRLFWIGHRINSSRLNCLFGIHPLSKRDSHCKIKGCFRYSNKQVSVHSLVFSSQLSWEASPFCFHPSLSQSVATICKQCQNETSSSCCLLVIVCWERCTFLDKISHSWLFYCGIISVLWLYMQVEENLVYELICF